MALNLLRGGKPAEIAVGKEKLAWEVEASLRKTKSSLQMGGTFCWEGGKKSCGEKLGGARTSFFRGKRGFEIKFTVK